MKLSYFNGRGLAETSRLILEIVGEPYEDFRYPLKILDWSTYSFERKEFDQDKADGKLDHSLGKVPFLRVDGEIIPQSKAIERYLARRFGLMGNDELEAAKIDGICEYVRDFKTEYQKTRALKDDERVQGMTKWFTETLPERLKALDFIVGREWAVGDKMSLADVVLYSFGTQFFDDVERTKEAFHKTEKIWKLVAQIEELPQIQSWLKRRPETDF